ncbi:dolichyl-phosphate beta-glucosyltransferase [Terriglobus sp. YAF25]|uniref:dolichyl-phosphate beta-glucosyltransferase n=1 Tax=Terriglobus sp. YAF25 TaxID=3233080 RepID=UPI003F9E0177
MSHPYLSIVIPAYNEAHRIGNTLNLILKCIEARQWDAELLVVDDGSTDRTVLQAAGDVVLFTDADLSAPKIEAERLMAALDAGADVAIGSRWLERSRQTVQQPLYRQIFGRCFNFVTRVMTGLSFKDTQCGFKAFKRDAAQVIFRLQTIERWGFDPELLFIASKLGYRIAEVPVTWGHDDRSRISYLRDGAKMLEEMAIIRFNAAAGRYSQAIAAMRDTSNLVTEPSRPIERSKQPAIAQ